MLFRDTKDEGYPESEVQQCIIGKYRIIVMPSSTSTAFDDGIFSLWNPILALEALVLTMGLFFVEPLDSGGWVEKEQGHGSRAPSRAVEQLSVVSAILTSAVLAASCYEFCCGCCCCYCVLLLFVRKL